MPAYRSYHAVVRNSQALAADIVRKYNKPVTSRQLLVSSEQTGDVLMPCAISQYNYTPMGGIILITNTSFIYRHV